MQAATAEHGARKEQAARAVGPLGYILSSPTTAALLALLTEYPERSFRFTELKTRIRAGTQSLLVSLADLQRARVVSHEGQVYRLPVDSRLAELVRELITQSRLAASEARRETFAESVARAGASPGGNVYRPDGPTLAAPMDEAERIAWLKRLPETPTDKRAIFEHTGAFAI